ncbi:pyruvate dehydrogenase (acetyl-transferring) E1 component subunit alpha [Marinilactibacillus psychrotolerans]|uniref:Pyruvate dehydrogenase E1 component subunit alpha n=1 Tax=Marinilactibacillus psychrotolerans TaxID=191770 RepID=A0A5R9C4M7_9LACT|nr:pyruvate dehydrogenase (acetyl-transferring) E1 component subunit alpha [Marinilactibacillus psychrotolerans]TLQ07831.1 pyruvate dehydrogenase (acetyl-transferring) E1 component subunit alpha [Marinilactibacillus psychrotolerans]
MAEKLSKLNFDKLVDGYKDNFKMYQVLDEKGKVVDEKTMKEFSDDELVALMEDIVWGRALDERTIILNRQGALANYATAGGQEASQFGTLKGLEEGDFLVPGYRDIGVSIKHGLPMHQAFMWYRGHVGGNKYDKDFQMMVPQVVVAGGITHAMGVAFAKKRNNEKNVVLAFTGDSATSEGDFYEGINFAGAFGVPLIVVVQNNGYGISVPVHEQTAAETLAQKGVAAGIASIQVDGMDPVATYAATRKAREYALKENKPVLIETMTYRFGPHTMSDDPKKYRTEEELGEWKKKDPIVRLRTYLQEKGLWEESREEEIKKEITKQAQQAIEKMNQEPEMKIVDLLENMYEVKPQNIKEQIEKYQAKEQK